jgi:hypothetical protein
MMLFGTTQTSGGILGIEFFVIQTAYIVYISEIIWEDNTIKSPDEHMASHDEYAGMFWVAC